MKAFDIAFYLTKSNVVINYAGKNRIEDIPDQILKDGYFALKSIIQERVRRKRRKLDKKAWN